MQQNLTRISEVFPTVVKVGAHHYQLIIINLLNRVAHHPARPPRIGNKINFVLGVKMNGISKKGALTIRSEEHTSELQSRPHLVCRLLLEKKKTNISNKYNR